MENLIKFLDVQKFDEVIVLENDSATKENINYFLDSYLNYQLDIYRKRARVLFAFTGHGGPGGRTGDPGSLILGNATGPKDYPNIYSLADLAPRLQNVGSKSYHFIALLGSCYSGGVFPPVVGSGDNNLYPGAPGAHAVTATKGDDLAYGIGADSGSLFFEKLIAGVISGNADRDYSGWVETPNGDLHLVGGGIVRLGALTAYISAQLDKLSINPATGKPFPQLRFGSLQLSQESGGAFFFLGPDRRNVQIAENIVLPADSLVTKGTGSSIQNYPEIKVFSAPDTYMQGIDISHHNGKIDWKKVAASNIKFVYMKATQSISFIDNMFEEHWIKSKEAGLKRGAYHYFSFCESADKQFDLIKRIIPKDEEALPIAIDVEWYDGPFFPRDKGCTDIQKIKRNLQTLAAQIEYLYKKIPIIYGTTSTYRDLVGTEFKRNAIWLQDFRKPGSQNQTRPSLPGHNPWTLWQFTSTANISGISGPVDVNAFFGSEREFYAFIQSGRNVALEAAQLSK